MRIKTGMVSPSDKYHVKDWGYEYWTIGITENPKKRKTAHRRPEKWERWKANTAQVAREIEKYFIDKGMKGGKGGGKNPIYDYVF